MNINVATAEDYISDYLISRGWNPLDWGVYGAANDLLDYMKENRLVRFEEVDRDVLVEILECGVRGVWC